MPAYPSMPRTRRRARAVAALALPLAAVAACSDGATAPGDTAPQASLSTSAFIEASAAGSEPTQIPDVRTSAGRVDITGTIRTPSPCQQVRAEASRQGTTLRLTVTARPRDVMCIAVLGHIPYEAALTAVPAGRYTLTVVHAYENTGWPDAEVLRSTVTVP